MPVPMATAKATDHYHKCNATSDEGFCGNLWLWAGSRAFWEYWLQGAEDTQCPGMPHLSTRLEIEFAGTSAGTNIGRRLKVGIKLRLWAAKQAPLEIVSPSLIAAGSLQDDASSSSASEGGGLNTSSMSLPKDTCYFKFKMQTVPPVLSKVSLVLSSQYVRNYEKCSRKTLVIISAFLWQFEALVHN